MKTRLLTSLVGVPLLVAAIIQPYVWIWGIIVLAVSLIGLYEFYRATGILKRNKPLCILGYISAIYYVSVCFVKNIIPIPFELLLLALLFIIMLIFNREISVRTISLTYLSTLYIPYLLSHIIGLRQLGGGQYYIWLIVICAFLTDTCAYFVGKAIGKNKLCPKISPNKTIEGAIGGVLGCGLSCMLFGYIITRFGADVNFFKLFVLGLICSVGAQLGDLTASAIKRQYGIKDYGTLFPGHGGILDRCDSIIFVAPIIYYYVITIGIFN